MTIASTALALSLLAVAADKKPLAIEDVFEFEYASDPRISPDGKNVVYVRKFSDVMTDKSYSNLWIVSTDGGGHRPLTSGNFGDRSPRFSHDGTRLAFVSDRSGSPQIHVRFMDTGETMAVTRLPHPPSAIAWSPDGKSLAFVAPVPHEPAKVADMPSPPPGAKWAEPARVVDSLVYRFDGVGYLPPAFMHVFVVPAEGGTPRQVTSGNFHHGSAGFVDSPPVFTPDGKTILVSASRRPDWEYEPLDPEIYAFGVEDGSVKALTHRRGPDAEPAVSPDGVLVAYTGFDDRKQGYQPTRLYLMNRDGTGARCLSAVHDRDVSSPVFAPDGRSIYALTTDRGNTKIARFALEGGEPRIVTGDVGSGRSAYGFDVSLSVSRDGTIAYPTTRPDCPGDVAVVGEGRLPKRLTALNDDLFSQRTLGAVEEVFAKSSVDGREIHGFLVKPPGFDPAKKWPLILEIHGGPFADYGDRFDLEKQMFAARGYVVLYVNPRGSTSYGEEFGNLIQHAYPGDDFFDLNSSVDAVVAKGYVDPARLFVTGGSGGGVLTCWMVGRTDRFRAAVSCYPVINWTSWVLTSDIPSFGVSYWFPGPPWEHPEHYAKRSLLSVVGNVTTPTMVMTGEDDYRTPMSESEQFYTALKLRRVESALVRVPGESHGIAGRPSHHMAKILSILGWFEKHAPNAKE